MRCNSFLVEYDKFPDGDCGEEFRGVCGTFVRPLCVASRFGSLDGSAGENGEYEIGLVIGDMAGRTIEVRGMGDEARVSENGGGVNEAARGDGRFDGMGDMIGEDIGGESWPSVKVASGEARSLGGGWRSTSWSNEFKKLGASTGL